MRVLARRAVTQAKLSAEKVWEGFGKGFGQLDLQAVIKSAASAASPPAWGAPDDGARWDDGVGRTTERIRTTARGAPQAVGEAALAADLITA